MSDTPKNQGGKTPAPQSETPAERKHLDERLDEALEESFPASDAPAVHEPKKPA